MYTNNLCIISCGLVVVVESENSLQFNLCVCVCVKCVFSGFPKCDATQLNINHIRTSLSI